jgi:hypothetical protein
LVKSTSLTMVKHLEQVELHVSSCTNAFEFGVDYGFWGHFLPTITGTGNLF